VLNTLFSTKKGDPSSYCFIN